MALLKTRTALAKYRMRFQLTYREELICVELLAAKSNIYAVEIPGQPVLFIARVVSIRDKPYWTSIPQGKEWLAAELGELIQAHLEKTMEGTGDSKRE